ncbi:CRISPR-associated endonuclease Cas1 [Spirulina subsalsa FACHB-351]|uniref:CRISPR-associated endonuclease Cas1 n=1 Tax=Spirulina subsalsa FACHB-351 TaxID=234711 RepID=A0ABT3L9Q9_9CYAN|nr:CRISPR-associated endonuclease Cas1 [Spirulina subsalsa]MCW6038251.1 CRISPR-associated endonuclease Cas1 [Spirulina subsalsa FACHB-351]
MSHPPPFSLSRLYAAWELVRRRSQSAGIDGITPELFAGVVTESLPRLQQHLSQEQYYPQPALGFHLPKKSGGTRLISIPTVLDRIVQRFLLQGIYPALEEVFTDCSHAYRPGLGVQTAITQAAEVYTALPTWVIKGDIAQFFDHLCWALLLAELEKLAISPPWVDLIAAQVKADVVVRGYGIPRNQGVLQGSILSGALANLYLSEFDRRCLATGMVLIRYGDDFVVLTGGLLEATRFLSWLEEWIQDFRLRLHPEKTRIIAPHEEFTFLGHQFKAGEIIPPVRKKPQPKAQSKRTATPPKRPLACPVVRGKGTKKNSFLDHWQENMTTLYVTEQQAYVKVKHQQFQVLLNQDLVIAVPVNRVSHLVLFGCCNVSHGAISLALQRRIPILFLSYQGRYFGRLQTDGVAQVKYLQRQVECSLNPDFALRQAKAIVAGKLHNCRILLLRLNRRSHHQTKEATEAIQQLGEWLQRVPEAESLEVLLGFEGQGTRVYFQGLGSLMRKPFVFEKRTRRPPTNPVNSLLSLGYTLVHQNLYSLVQGVGLHPHFGNLHVPRENHPALVSDLMEEFRAPLVDSLVMFLVNSKVFKLEDFTPPDARGGVYLYPDKLKVFLKHWQERLQLEVKHPQTGYKVSNFRCLELQVWEYIACLMGEQEVYRPMLLSNK